MVALPPRERASGREVRNRQIAGMYGNYAFWKDVVVVAQHVSLLIMYSNPPGVTITASEHRENTTVIPWGAL